MHRRSLLALVGSLAAGSGCTGTGADPPMDSTVTPAPVPTSGDSPTEPATPAPNSDVRIRAVVQPGYAVPGTDTVDVVDDAGQYLLLTVAGEAPDRSAVRFRFDGVSYLAEDPGRPLYRDDSGTASYGEDGGPLVFALPETGDATDAELAWGEGSWAPPPTVVDRLEDPLPPFSVSLDGPERADAGADVQLTVRVSNEGEGAGRYVLALNRQGPDVASTPVTRLAGELDAGGSETHTVDAVPPKDDRSTRYSLAVPGQRDDARHEISPADG